MSERKLIYVDDLEKALLDADCDVCDIQNDYDYSWGFSRDSLEEIIKTVPTVDAAPVVHGHWIDAEVIGVDTPTVRCSVCSMRFCDLINNHRYMYRYCPYCGAKMDEVEE